MTHLLIVEDDAGLRRALTLTFRARQFAVDAAASGRTALDMLGRTQPSLVIMDLGLPDIDGIELIGQFRARTSTPIIVLSGRRAQHQKVDALDAGADDYVVKPFEVEELVARARAALRRPELGREQPARVTTSSFELDLAGRRATRGGEPVALTPLEWRLIEALVRRPGTLVASADLLTRVWGPNSARDTHFLRIHVGHLRHKLEEYPARPRHIVTVKGLGYRFDP